MEITTETLQTTALNAPDIECGGCANAIKNAVGNLEGVSQVEVDVEKKRVTIKHDQRASRESLIKKATSLRELYFARRDIVEASPLT